jgi:cyclohexyl-isocyanide hydratase
MATFRIGFVLFPRMTQLDLTGPYEILSRMRDAEALLVAKTLEPVGSDRGLSIVPTATFAACPPLDLICVPGGRGVNEVLGDREILGFVRQMAEHARYVTSVCTGSLVLGAAGLLRGRRAASHWLSREALRSFGAEPSGERVTVDGNIITGGGVTAGIDFALRVAEELHGKAAAEAIQLMVEYDPHPPFDAGSPERAGPELVERIRRAAEPLLRERDAAVAHAAKALDATTA